MAPIRYQNAYKEVYEILQELVEEDYKKIPEDIIKLLEHNKNDEYEFYLDDDLELENQNLLPETKAILYNLFRDYLSEPWQKDKIIKWQNEERQKNEDLKKKKYKSDLFDKDNVNKEYDDINVKSNKNNVSNSLNNQILEYKENKFIKILKFIKNIFKK